MLTNFVDLVEVFEQTEKISSEKYLIPR